MLRFLFSLFWGPAPGPGWVLIGGLASGFIFGAALVGVNERLRIVEVLTFSERVVHVPFPKPVTPPPAGMQWAQVLTTGYCGCEICCPGTSDGKTSINRDIREYPYGYASDPRLLPPLTRLDVPGYGTAVVDDTGGAMRQDGAKGVIHIDLRFPDHQKARTWGRQLMWLAVPEGSGAARLAAAGRT
jgi:3D (Asp-Asp-Asp) domain-containing protein